MSSHVALITVVVVIVVNFVENENFVANVIVVVEVN